MAADRPTVVLFDGRTILQVYPRPQSNTETSLTPKEYFDRADVIAEAQHTMPAVGSNFRVGGLVCFPKGDGEMFSVGFRSQLPIPPERSFRNVADQIQHKTGNPRALIVIDNSPASSSIRL